LIAVATIGAAAVTFGLMALRNGSSPMLAAASGAGDTSAEHRSTAAESVPATSNETWSTEHRAFWLGNRRGAAFELLAENKVHTWFGPTQPVLVVRCVSHTTEALVYTRSATRIEPHAEGKTVTVSVDDEPAQTEHWADSDDKVALFAPDGAAFAQRLLNAKTLRFGYSPHNADDVVAQFNVAGLSRLIAPVARECGWKK
jgi:Type VI secretion system VasI, EvfG, VC_A0118